MQKLEEEFADKNTNMDKILAIKVPNKPLNSYHISPGPVDKAQSQMKPWKSRVGFQPEVSNLTEGPSAFKNGSQRRTSIDSETLNLTQKKI
jgi:hypothetical protein